MQMKSLSLILAAAVAMAAAAHAEDAKPAAAAADAATEAAPAAAEAKPKMEVAKNDAPGSLKKGNEFLDAGQFEEAAAWYEGIGEQSSKKREPYRLNNWALALIGLQQYEKAAELAQKAIDADSKVSAAWNNLGTAQANQGQRAEAVETYKKGIETLKAANKDTSKLETNLAALETAIEEGKPKKVREAEAKAKAEVEAKAKSEAAAPAAGAEATEKN